MKRNLELSSETVRDALEYERVGNVAVHKAQAENRKFGLPNIYSRGGRLIFEMPDGEIFVDRAPTKAGK